jgi:mannosyl-oligosaccharide alpha-1,2-mannosidase
MAAMYHYDILLCVTKVMEKRQRWKLFLASAALLVVLIYQFPLSLTAANGVPTFTQPHQPLYKSPAKADDGRFYWSELPIRNPVQHYIPFPNGRPRKLPKVQYSFEAETRAEARIRLQRLAEVKKTFDRSWQSYKDRAWMKDELTPISGSSRNSYGGWAASLVDTLDTLWIMDMKEDFGNAVFAAANIDFTTTNQDTISVFETTIRHLGGFLSAYDLSADATLLHLAIEVGEMLYAAFDTPNRFPVTHWNLNSAKEGASQLAPEWAFVAEIGSLSLEFTRLSQLTGDPKYFDAIQRLTYVFSAQQNYTKLPGMWPVSVKARETVLTSDKTFSLGAMADSMYEYFPKQYALLGGADPIYEKLYRGSMTTAISHALFRPMTFDNADILISGNVVAKSPTNTKLDALGQHLSCFTGGMFALGGQLFSIPEHVTIGRKLTDGCIWAYRAMSTGIMPEKFQTIPCPARSSCTLTEKRWREEILRQAGMDPDITDDNAAAELIAEKRLPRGFTDIQDRRYILRPEAIESIFILYRITGDRQLLDAGWEMFIAITKHTATEFANAALDDVTVSDPPQADNMESFWMAETLKYFYLLFSEPSVLSLDEWVFNTEAHPLRRPR